MDGAYPQESEVARSSYDCLRCPRKRACLCCHMSGLTALLQDEPSEQDGFKEARVLEKEAAGGAMARIA